MNITENAKNVALASRRLSRGRLALGTTASKERIRRSQRWEIWVAKLFTEIDATNTRALWMLPPEALDSSESDRSNHRIDIYHCGLLFLHLLNGRELRFTVEETKAGGPRELALQLPPPHNFALEKALRRHVAYRTENAMELWRDLSSPEPPLGPQAEQLTLPEAPPVSKG